VNLALLGALAAVTACNGDSETSDSEAGNATPPARPLAGLKQVGGSKTICPAALTGEEGPSPCKLVLTGADLTSCRTKGVPGGYDLWVHGISCQFGASLLVPLGCNFPNLREGPARYLPGIDSDRSALRSDTN